ncbi:U-box domain-containing protein 7-like [Triticum urartu]|uniref:RING-type E3 ubiquitin transferase n=1 Tax=Triticum urartu TaxID=4572 RepID=A0A8R7QXY1_TRIUA|nr:U-box domain-containing protein 7-like [Triticum urartu]XP_048540779.1 U-box domain-containing protein 7-like [Triticum urartu]XP_048540780.1 U-box domain-containing protein 7-like [Triticum urartu]XP_048540781.1 U-box domain-containing protein 7-like [Triticum urartu]XP_048540783.1 U-box domain-containing protein 7-like [Triticum urartu]
MENNNDGMFGTPEHSSHPKVHSLMCSELKMMLDKVTSILPSIEAAQPGCKAGIEELCNLYSIVDKGKLIIQNCIECSSLYLAITGEATAMRCERIRNSMRRSLFLIQNMVPSMLADQVADVHNDLRNMKFLVDPAEEEAGKAVLKMLRHSDATEELEMHTFLLACSKLNLTSQKAMLIERRAIKKLLDKINGNDPKKEGILSFFLYLVRKYGKNSKPETGAKNGTASETTCTNVISSDTGAHRKCIPGVNSGTGRYDDQNNLSGLATPPPELCCPISMKLMHDPVIIASGQTYERENIERWFSKGYDTCPRTQVNLENFTITPNTCMQAVIYNWCKEQKLECTYLPEQFHNYSLSSLHDISAPLIAHKNFDYMIEHSGSSVALSGASYLSSPVRETDVPKTSFTRFYSNVNCQLYLSFCNFDKEMFLNLFQELSELPVELQRQSVKDLKAVLNSENEVWQSMISNGFLEAFLEFLQNDNLRSTLQAQKTGIYFFLTFLCNSRTRILSITEDAVRLIVSLVDSELKLEALLILHELLHHPICRESPLMASLVAPSVTVALDTGDNECLQLALKMIFELSSSNDVKSLLISPGIIAKLSTLLSEVSLTEYCLKIMRNLCEVKQAADLIIRSEHYIGSISDHLDTGSRSEQEHASVILHTVCSRSTEADRFLVMKEGVIPALVDLSVYGTEVAKASSIKLLQILGGSGVAHAAVDGGVESSPNGSICKQPISKSARYISRKLSIFSKPRSRNVL